MKIGAKVIKKLNTNKLNYKIMKVISRFMAKMPVYKNSTRIRYEIELLENAKKYYVIRYQYVSNKLYKCTLIAANKNKEIAIEYYNKELLTFTGLL